MKLATYIIANLIIIKYNNIKYNYLANYLISILDSLTWIELQYCML